MIGVNKHCNNCTGRLSKYYYEILSLLYLPAGRGFNYRPHRRIYIEYYIDHLFVGTRHHTRRAGDQ